MLSALVLTSHLLTPLLMPAVRKAALLLSLWLLLPRFRLLALLLLTLPACSTDAAVLAAYTAWAGGFSFTGGCSATTNIGTIPALTANAFCAGANLSFTYTVTDACGSQSCSSTFAVAPATPIQVTCAPAVNLPACSTDAAVLAAYTAWAGGFSFTGGCSATTNIGTIPALTANAFCAGANLSFTYTVTDACGSQSCSSTFAVAPATPIQVTCAPAVNLPACSTDAAVLAAYTAWAGGFSFTGGCSATTNIGTIPALTANAFCAGANLSFTYTVTDACGSQSCSSTFAVAPATPIQVTCAPAVNLPACSTDAAVLAAYTAWAGGFSFTGGCSATTNIGTIPALTANAFCAGANLSFTYTVTDACGSQSCSSTFAVAPATPIQVTCAPAVNLPACSTDAAVLAAYTAWAGGFSFTGGCSATTNIGTIPALTANAFCAGANLSFTYTVTDACGSQSCSSTFAVAPATPIQVTCAPAVNLPACSTDAAVLAAYTAWAGGFSFTGGCSATTNIGTIPALTANAFCAGANLSFTYTVTDACGSQSCSSTFAVAPATPIQVTCAPAVNLPACSTDAAVLAAYTAWAGGFSFTGGCSATTNIGTIPALTANAFCAGANLSFTYTVTDACGSQSCSSTFAVAPATPIQVTCAPAVNLPACSTDAAVLAAYTAWAGGFSFTGGCSATTNIGSYPGSDC